MRISISGRLTLMFALLMIGTVATFALFLRSSLLSSLEGMMHNELVIRNSLMAPYIEYQGSVENWSHVEQKLATLSSNERDKVSYLILSKDQQYRVGSLPVAALNYDQLPEGFSTIPNVDDPCPLYMLVQTLKPLGDRPEVKFIVALNSRPYYSTLAEFTSSLIFSSVAGLSFVILLSYFISRYGLRPARHLSEQAHGLAPGEPSQRLETNTLPSELYSLAVAFNGALERQEIAWKQLESFNADVAHELRTPLTNLIGQTQLALSRQRIAPELEELLESNLEELERMTSIVNDMLFLSHAMAGQSATELSEVSLREEALKTYDYIEPSLLDKSLSLDIVGDVRARVDKRLFHRALANLLENGARYAPTGSAVRVTLSHNGYLTQIAVSNVGDAIEERHLERLFERFYRVDAARNGSHMHHGLGLAIVNAVALMHGGKAFARSEAGINTFGFTLRIAPAGHESQQAEALADGSQLAQSVSGQGIA